MDKRDDQELFIPPAGSYMNPVNQPPPSLSPPSYGSASIGSGIDDSHVNENDEMQNDSSEDDSVSCKTKLVVVCLQLIFVG